MSVTGLFRKSLSPTPSLPSQFAQNTPWLAHLHPGLLEGTLITKMIKLRMKWTGHVIVTGSESYAIPWRTLRKEPTHVFKECRMGSSGSLFRTS
jgi:hypothetical protein